MIKKLLLAVLAVSLGACASLEREQPEAARKVGVVYVYHGGSDGASPQSSWEATLQIFVYDPNSTVYKHVIWNADLWPRILDAGNAPKELGKYAFEYERIGGVDPSPKLSLEVYEQLRANLEAQERALGVDFVVDHASWLAPDPAHHAYPRLIFEPRVPGGSRMTFCHEDWKGCDPHRYDVDGTIERLLAAGVDEIYMIDLTTSGVRFFKTWDVVNVARQVVDRHNARHGTNVTVRWVNDPTDLMTASYPSAPERWTLSLGEPEADRKVPLAGRPNPVSSDPRLAVLQAQGIIERFSPDVSPANTGVLLVNHATRTGNRHFDPKVDDTLVLNDNIRAELLERYPDMDGANVVEAWFGRREENPNISADVRPDKRRERTRRMRGENLGDAYLYESDELPQGDDGHLYWEALEYLKDRGVHHIVVAFPQIVVDSVLNLVELPNQIGKELGYRSWLDFAAGDFETYPGVGHPFADYWGIWVDTQCPARSGAGTEPCCFVMGGCADGRPYPPLRVTPLDEVREDLDPSLAFDVPAWGHLGYDPAKGAPREDRPVQGQYTGTWATWQPPNAEPGVAQMLAEEVVEAYRASQSAPLPANGIALHALD